MNDYPRVGLGVLIRREGNVLWGKRKNAHGEGTWCFPGGHLEFGESFEDCAIRETDEEVGITIKNIRFWTVTNDFFVKENKHYVTIFMLADYAGGDVELKEPEKFERWEWLDFNHMPSPLFLPFENFLKRGEPFPSE